MKLWVCDYINPQTSNVEAFVLETDEDSDVMNEAINHLKALGIPKRYLVNLEEF